MMSAIRKFHCNVQSIKSPVELNSLLEAQQTRAICQIVLFPEINC